MINAVVRTVIRTRFALTRRSVATGQIHASLGRYLALADQLDAVSGARPVRVPAMPGIDADMRRWSLFMTLEHNAIVNRAMTTVIGALARGEEPPGGFDPKRDVMPSASPGVETVDDFRSSVEEYLALEATLGKLRGTQIKNHPIFGPFDAHRWHCMLGFHLRLHERQARFIVKHSREPQTP